MKFLKLMLNVAQAYCMNVIDFYEACKELESYIDEFFDSHNRIYSFIYLWFWAVIYIVNIPIDMLIVSRRIKHNDEIIELIEKYK